MQSKKCTKCGEVKDLSAFWKRTRTKDGLMSYCKICGCKQQTSWRNNNRYKVNKYAREDRERNIEKYKERDRKYWAKNKCQLIETNKKWRSENKEHVEKRRKKWVEKNKNTKLYLKFDLQCINLTDAYIAHVLRLPVSECHPELIEAKRAQLKLLRAIKEL